MKLYFKSLFLGMIWSIFLFLVLFSFFSLAFPLENWKDLWTTSLFGFPFIGVVLLVVVLFGLVVGTFVSTYWSKRIRYLEEGLHQLLKSQTISPAVTYEEMEKVKGRLVELQQFIQDQTIRTQKLIEERATDQEEKLNQVISDERNRLARELHDSVSQELFAASMLVSAVNAANKDPQSPVAKQLGQIESIIHQAQLEMRALLLHLRPIALKDKTLKEGIEQLLEELQEKVPMNITTRLEDVSVNKGVEDHLFRILQEALSNALRHAKAEKIHVVLLARDELAILKIEDNGIGFSLEEKQQASYGIINMEERAKEIGGHLHLISLPEKGTKIEVRVPIIEKGGDPA